MRTKWTTTKTDKILPLFRKKEDFISTTEGISWRASKPMRNKVLVLGPVLQLRSHPTKVSAIHRFWQSTGLVSWFAPKWSESSLAGGLWTSASTSVEDPPIEPDSHDFGNQTETKPAELIEP